MHGVVDSKFIRALPPDPLNQDSEGAWHSLGQEANKARELKKKKIDRAIKAAVTLNLHDKVCEAVGCKYLHIGINSDRLVPSRPALQSPVFSIFCRFVGRSIRL